jgi:hypothetical protein
MASRPVPGGRRERPPLEVVPLEYRNDETFRRLIAEGKLRSAWA